MLLFILGIWRAAGSSSGFGTSCNAEANMGCSSWDLDEDGNENRLACNDPDMGEMEWASKPVRAPWYTVRTGDFCQFCSNGGDPTSYVPGEVTTIYVRNLDYDMKYRGLVLHANDENNDIVGEWVVPRDSNIIVHPPCSNPGVLMHQSAELKPTLLTLNWLAPPAGTGTVTFKGLIKEGPANHGAFYYPNMDLVLTEAEDSIPNVWVMGQVLQNCDQVCEDVGQLCAQGVLDLVDSAEDFDWLVRPQVTCNLPYLGDCTGVAPSFSSEVDSMCTYTDTACEDWRDPQPTLCGTAPTGETTRLCPCTNDGEVPDEMIIISSSSRANTGWLWFALTCATSVSLLPIRNGSSKSGSVSSVVAAMLALSLFGGLSVDAHNWQMTPARASEQASTIKPCQARKDSDTHVQIAPGQLFSVKWATGHTRDSIFVVVAGEDAHWLAHSDFTDYVDDYIANAPDGSNVALTDTYQRYHGTKASDTTFYDTSDMYISKLDPSDPNFIDHPRAPTEHLYKYDPALLIDDVVISYESDAYPWLESVFVFPHLYHLPRDFDGIQLTVNGRKGPGHYIVAWRWNGYYDCTDVDVRNETVEEIYGVDTGTFVWSRVDHCQYIEPKKLETGCFESPRGADHCRDFLPGDGFGAETDRLGVNVVPLVNPDTVYAGFQHIVNIPFNNPDCVENGWTRVYGEVTESEVDWNAWERTADLVDNLICTAVSWTATQITLREAVLRCSSLDCVGIAFSKPVSTSTTTSGATSVFYDPAQFPYEGLYDFAGCTSSGVSVDTTAATIWKQNIPDVPSDNIDFEPVTVSFQRSDAEVDTMPAGYVRERGLMYELRKNTPELQELGRVYGWLCNHSDSGGEANGTPSTADDAYIHVSQERSYDFCNPDGSGSPAYQRYWDNMTPNTWQMEVPNGVYSVTVNFRRSACDSCSIDIDGCSVNNQALSESDASWNDGTSVVRSISYTQNVEVEHGFVTLRGNPDYIDDRRCKYVSSLTIERHSKSLPVSWLPPQSNPWWSMDLGEETPVGIVNVEGHDRYECQSFWLYAGSGCRQDFVRPLDDFGDFGSGGGNGVFTGFTVKVSDTPCSGRSCPGIVCQSNSSSTTKWDEDNYIDCKGKSGRYLNVLFPGDNRVYAPYDITVNSLRPKLTDPNNTLVCYGVEARQADEVSPEYIISLDPEDPIFYSTCYVREKNITWLDVEKSSPSPTDWRYNGKCLDCDSYHSSVALGTDSTGFPVTQFKVADRCYDCNEFAKPESTERENVKTYTYMKCNDGHPGITCEDPSECLIWLDMPGRSSLTFDECVLMVQTTEGCSNTFQYQSSRNCQCYAKESCCGSCTLTPSSSWEIFELDPGSPDPTCSQGMLSPDGSMCCENSCVRDDGENICAYNTSLSGRCRWGVHTTGMCCSDGAQKSCDDSGFPCLMA
jgi:hypothetical protein